MHVLSPPLAFALSQDQTLQFDRLLATHWVLTCVMPHRTRRPMRSFSSMGPTRNPKDPTRRNARLPLLLGCQRAAPVRPPEGSPARASGGFPPERRRLLSESVTRVNNFLRGRRRPASRERIPSRAPAASIRGSTGVKHFGSKRPRGPTRPSTLEAPRS